jgi:hypothetical protein
MFVPVFCWDECRDIPDVFLHGFLSPSTEKQNKKYVRSGGPIRDFFNRNNAFDWRLYY